MLHVHRIEIDAAWGPWEFLLMKALKFMITTRFLNTVSSLYGLCCDF